MTATSATLAAAAHAGAWTLAVALHLEKDGPEAAREPVRESDLDDARSELWLAAFLRKGHPDVPIDDMASRLTPLFKQDPEPHCRGFILETTNPGGETVRHEFSLQALDQVAARGAQRLLAAGIMRPGDRYFYEVVAGPQVPAAAAARSADDGFTVTVRNPPLSFLKIPLRPLLAGATTVGEVDDRWGHVFYTAEALARAERLARKGAESHPPVETGAVLVGPPCSCPESGELFVVVCEVLEVHDAEEEQFSLTYSGKSWARIQAVMKARQAQPATRAHRILGQCHGHNFPPADGAPPCELCSKVKVCTRTSVFVSPADRTWSRAIFSRQPWQLCHIFGLNARKEQVHTLFGLRDGGLTDRGFHIIPAFPPI